MGPRGRRQVFRISYLNCGAEWLSSLVALGLLGFYSFALITTPLQQRGADNYKLLASNVILSAYMRLCYILHTSSKTYMLLKHGPVETTALPLQAQIGRISSFMFIVEPGHFVCLCWITHISFPFKSCSGLSYWAACSSLHIMSTIFVAAWVLTGLAFAFLILCFTIFERGRGNNMERTLRMAPIPNHIRESLINALPISEEPPADGEVCAICCDLEEPNEEGPTRWRILPCGHRFHPTCVDEWLKKGHVQLADMTQLLGQENSPRTQSP